MSMETDSDLGGPDLGRVPSPLTLDMAREAEEQSLPDIPQRSVRTQPSNVRHSRRRDSAQSVRDMERAVEQWQREASELRQLLDDSAEQLMSEKQRSDQLEDRLRGSDAKFIAHDVARQKAEMEAAKAAEEMRRYKLQLEVALREIQRAQETVDAADDERNRAEEAAARARDRERKLIETIQLRDAREQGRAEGRAQGIREGISRGRAEGRTDERGRALRAFEEFVDRQWPDGIPADLPSPTLQYSRREQERERERDRPMTSIEARLERLEQDPVNYAVPNRVRTPGLGLRSPIQAQRPQPEPVQTAYAPQQDVFTSRSRRGSDARRPSPGPQLPPMPSVPDVAPMVTEHVYNAFVTPQRAPQPMFVSPSPSRTPSRAVSRAHTPVANIPDGYVPVIGPNDNIILPPPHEVQPTPGVLPQEEAERFGDRSLSRQPSRVSMRSMRDIVSPAPQRVLDPANLFQNQPGVPPDQGEGNHSLRDIRNVEGDTRSERSGRNGRDGYDDRGSEYGRSVRGIPPGRLSRISEAGSERGGPAPDSARYAAQRQLPASRAPSVYSRAPEGSQYNNAPTVDRERMRYELRNSDPELVEELINGSRDGSGNGSGQSGFSHVRRPPHIIPPAPLDPANYPARSANNASRASAHSRSASNPMINNGPPTSDPWSRGHRRRGTSITSAAPTIFVQPPSDPNSPARRRSMVPPDIPDIPNTAPPSPALSDRTVRQSSVRNVPMGSRPGSVYNQPAGRAPSVYGGGYANGGGRPPSVAPTVRETDYADPQYRPASRAAQSVREAAYEQQQPVYSRAPSRAASVAPSVRQAAYEQPAYRPPSRAASMAPSARDGGFGDNAYRAPSRAASIAPGARNDNYDDGGFRAPSRAGSVAPSVRNVGFSGGGGGFDEYGGRNPAAVPLPHSAAPSFAPLPDMGRGPSRYNTPGAANYALPPSDNRTEYARTPGRPYDDLPNPYAPAPQRPASRAQTVAGSMVASPTPPERPRSRLEMGRSPYANFQTLPESNLPPPGRPASRAHSMHAPGTNRSYYPPLPDAGGTEWGSPEESQRGRPLSRAAGNGPGQGSGGFVVPGMASKSPYYDPAPLSPNVAGSSNQLRREQSRVSMRSQRFNDRDPAENEVDMAFLANGGQSALRNSVAGPSRPASRAASLRSVLKKAGTPRFATNVDIESEPDVDAVR